jgi:iron complex outermembrane recepter protein
MKKYHIIIFVFLSLFPISLITIFAESPGISLTGKISDKNTGEVLAGVTVYIPDLKTGAVSGNDGSYKIEHLPQTKVLVQVNLIGYKTKIETIDLTITSVRNFTMEYVATELNEVVVTGTSQAAEQKRTPVPITVVSRLTLLQNSSNNIIDAISNQPGISQVTTGSGISKPVIRGLGFNRVVVVNDGIRQEGQQWGDEHGVEVDEYSVNKVEILKGPASLAYGSDAMAGVVNMLSAPNQPNGSMAANFSTNYQTNNGLFGYSGDFSGNKNGMIWDLRYSSKMAHAYQNKFDGYVFNSGFKENALSGLIGLNKSWGYSNLLISLYNLQPGIVEGDRDSLSGMFIKQIADGPIVGTEIALKKDFKSYTPQTPYQQIHHYKMILSNNFLIGNGNLRAIIGFQQNQRQEFGDILQPEQYGLYFLLNTLNYDFRFIFPEYKGYSISIGTNGMNQYSANKGIEFLVPEYHLFDAGIFAIIKKSMGAIDISGGLRYDNRNEQGNALYLNSEGVKLNGSEIGAIQKFSAFNSRFYGVSGSLGATWQLSESFYTKLNISRGFRAPNIAELGSNGVHEGTLRYEVGNANLSPEHSLQLDYSLGLNREHISAEINIFDNTIQNFIYAHKLSSILHGDSIREGYYTYFFDSGTAHLFGGEVRFDIHPHPLDWLHFENAFSFVNATQKSQPDSSRYLPLTPAPKLQTSIKADLKKYGNFIRNAYIRLDMDNYFEQNHYYAAYGTETKTPGYALINLGLGSDFVRKEKLFCSFYISISNLTDVAYQSHLSRLKYGPENYLTGRTGVFNMGRNVSFKLIVPINF